MSHKALFLFLFALLTLCSLSPAYGQSASAAAGLRPFQRDGRWGYVDSTGAVRVEPRFADRFVGGLASVHLGDAPDERRGYINRQGRYAWVPTPFKYKSLEDVRAQADRKEKEEESLTPLTDEEKALDPRRIVAGQPDFLADLTFFRSEAYSGGGGAMRLARKGKRYRMESPYWLFIGEEGKPAARVSTSTKLYDDMEPARDESADGSSPFNPRTLAEEPNVTFNTLGTVVIDGHRCLKIEAARKGEPQKIYLYAARDLKDLIIVGQVLNPPRGFVQRLSNISLEVPDELVTIPSDYKPIEHDRWTKVETARVTYKGRPSKDFVVFRAPGGELFIRVGDAPYDWTYLVRPREGTAETAFQGLLVTRDGKYVWHTKESEAFSDTSYRVRVRGPYDNPEDERAVVGPNAVKFRSNDYKKDRAMIEVRW